MRQPRLSWIRPQPHLVLLAAVLVGCSGGDGKNGSKGPTGSVLPSLPDGGSPSQGDAASQGPGPDGSSVLPPGPDGAVPPDFDAAAPDQDANTPSTTGDASASHAGTYQEVFDQGLTRYVGTDAVKETNVTTSNGIDVHHFAKLSKDTRGPVCMYGDDYFVESREGSSDTLMIFLQGGGVCLSEICAATPDPILSLQLFNLASFVGIGGMLDPGNPQNPTKDFDVVNAPYCDGSLFAGDVDRILSDGNPNTNGGDQDPAYQRGLINLTATLEVAKKLHPNPPRIVLAGSSGGAYGVVAGTVLVRYYYPDVPLLVFSDSGAPIVNGIDKGFITRALTELKAIKLIPKSCPDCIANGHATGMLEWALGFDSKLSVAYMTHARDHVIGEFFMRTTADQFEHAVITETDRLISEFPGRAFRFVIPSDKHTLAMGIDYPDGLQGGLLSLTGSFGVGFVGPDVNSTALSSWHMGSLSETGKDDDGQTWVGYDWLRSLINDPSDTPNVLQLQ